MQNKKVDAIDKFIYKFVNMSDERKRKFLNNLSAEIEKIENKITRLTEKQNKLFESYFKLHKKLDRLKMTEFYKKGLELISKKYDNKILNLQKDKNKIEIDMLYGTLIDKKSKGLDIEIVK